MINSNSFFIKLGNNKIHICYPNEWEIKKINSRGFTSEESVSRVFNVKNSDILSYWDINPMYYNQSFINLMNQIRNNSIKAFGKSARFSEIEKENDNYIYFIYLNKEPLTLVIYKQLNNSIMIRFLLSAKDINITEQELQNLAILLINSVHI